jgi:hypothetical protein
MTKLEIFNRMMNKAKANGYKGPDYKYQTGQILDGTNYYALIFREDFAKAVWGEESLSILVELTEEDRKKSSLFDASMRHWSNYRRHLAHLSVAKDKWKYLEQNAI